MILEGFNRRRIGLRIAQDLTSGTLFVEYLADERIGKQKWKKLKKLMPQYGSCYHQNLTKNVTGVELELLKKGVNTAFAEVGYDTIWMSNMAGEK